MNARKFATPSALMAIAMICASVAMLTQNSIAAADHIAPAVQRTNAGAVTELPPVVITGKRLKVSEKANYLSPRQLIPATLV